MRYWKIIGAIIALLGEGALQMSGYTSLPLAIALGVVIVVLIIWSAWPTLKRIRLQKPIKLQGSQQNISEVPAKSIILSHDYIADTYIRGQLVYLMDLIAPGAQPIISDRTIEDCEIRGPAMIALLGRVTIKNGTFDGDVESLFVEVADKRIIFGAIGLRDCVFRRCRFVAIGIIGTREQIEKAKKGFTPSASHKKGSQTE